MSFVVIIILARHLIDGEHHLTLLVSQIFAVCVMKPEHCSNRNTSMALLILMMG